MKILHINCSDTGSTGRIVQDICAEANIRGWDSVSLFPRKHREANPGIREYEVSLPFEQGIYRRIYHLYGLHYGFAPLSTRKILHYIWQEKPDVVHLHSINCATVNIYRLVWFLKRKNIATVITNHAEFMYTGNCPHAYECEKWLTGCGKCPDLFAASDSKLFDRTHTAWMKMKKAFQGHENVSVVSVYFVDYEFHHSSKQTTLNSATNVTNELYYHASKLFDQLWNGQPIRLLGIHVSKATSENHRQYSLFEKQDMEKLSKLDSAIDKIRHKYGDDSIKRATFLKGDA